MFPQIKTSFITDSKGETHYLPFLAAAFPFWKAASFSGGFRILNMCRPTTDTEKYFEVQFKAVVSVFKMIDVI